MNLNTAPVPVHQQIYDRLRDAVLFGDMAPGSAVTIQGIVAETGAGMTPVREALRRLVAAGALTLKDNRRVEVPVLSASDIAEIAYLRGVVEPELARRAAAFADMALINELAACDNALDAAIANEDVAAYLSNNYHFHARLYAAAHAPILAATAEGLWLRFGPSMRVICGRLGTAESLDQHKAMLAGLTDGNADKVAAAMARDVAQGVAHLSAHAEERFD